MKRRR
jgi:hypothetical protein